MAYIYLMCCCFYIEPGSGIKRLIDQAVKSPLTQKMTQMLSKPLVLEGEARPTNIVSSIAKRRGGGISVFPMQWGFRLLDSNRRIFNIRSESAEGKWLFKESFKYRRCVIPCSWYFEWSHYTDLETGKMKTGRKYAIHPENEGTTYLAGLYGYERKEDFEWPVFALLTKDSSESVRFIHDRMPLILPESLIGSWVEDDESASEIMKEALGKMVFREV